VPGVSGDPCAFDRYGFRANGWIRAGHPERTWPKPPAASTQNPAPGVLQAVAARGAGVCGWWTFRGSWVRARQSRTRQGPLAGPPDGAGRVPDTPPSEVLRAPGPLRTRPNQEFAEALAHRLAQRGCAGLAILGIWCASS
jgi:hypothetical protein